MKKALDYLIAKSPVKFRKMLIFRTSAKSVYNTATEENLYYMDMTKDLIDKDHWLSQNKSLLYRHLKSGYNGFAGFDVDSKQCLGYSWFAVNRKPPTSIPQVPDRCAWIFNMMISEKFRGRKLQIQFLKHFAALVRKNHESSVDFLYADILVDNIPSRKNFIRAGYEEAGIYLIFIAGIRRYPFLNIKLGRWVRDQEHPEIQK